MEANVFVEDLNEVIYELKIIYEVISCGIADIDEGVDRMNEKAKALGLDDAFYDGVITQGKGVIEFEQSDLRNCIERLTNIVNYMDKE